jgi:hypothetical protein
MESGQWDAWRGLGSVGGVEFSPWVKLGRQRDLVAVGWAWQWRRGLVGVGWAWRWRRGLVGGMSGVAGLGGAAASGHG